MKSSKELSAELKNKLSQKEYTVIYMSQFDNYPRSVQEIASYFGCGEEEIIQIRQDICKKYPDIAETLEKHFLFRQKCVMLVKTFGNRSLSWTESEEIIEEILSESSERDRNIIYLRFGLENQDAKTLREIGKLNGISGERVRQIEHRTISKIKSKVIKKIQKKEEKRLATKLSELDIKLPNCDFFESAKK